MATRPSQSTDVAGEWDCYISGNFRCVVKVGRTATGVYVVCHPQVQGGLPQPCRGLVSPDGWSLQYEGYRGKLSADQRLVTWSGGVEWRRRSDAKAPLAEQKVSPRGTAAQQFLVSEADIRSAGLHVTSYTENHITDRRRAEVRENTKSKVQQELQLMQWGEPVERAAASALPHGDSLALFIDSSNYALHSPDALPTPGTAAQAAEGGSVMRLGRFDVLAVPGRADLDSAWQFRRFHDRGLERPFLVLHAAALNIGESTTTATDWFEYCLDGKRLDESRYIEDMGRIFDNILKAAIKLNVKHLVWFPFGMGAFLRHLGSLDDRFSGRDIARNQAQVDLRRALCRRFARAVQTASRSSAFKLYLALGPSGHGDEADVNADAFIRALSAKMSPAVSHSQQGGRDMIQVCLHADALELAHELAASQRGAVAMVNGTNRHLIGNHWFEDGARRAIDENLHRRSWWLAAYAYVLNVGCRSSNNYSNYGNSNSNNAASVNTLEFEVQRLGGKVHQLN